LRAQLELEWRSHLAHEISGREAAAQAALELAVGESGTASLMAERELRETLSLK
jgi:hypothetical protein